MNRVAFGLTFWWAAAAVLAAIASTAFAAPADPRAYCGEADFKNAEAQEARCLGQLAQLASRKGNSLVLRLDGGETKIFASNPRACDTDEARDCIRYCLVGYHPQARLFLIGIGYYEGGSFLMVSARDGTETKLGSIPHFAPDGLTFAIVYTDLENSTPYDFAVGTVATIPPSLTWTANAGLGEWEFGRWIDKDRIAIVLVTQTPDCPKPNCDAVLIRQGKDWTREFLPPKQ
jgi:hypothetical protein